MATFVLDNATLWLGDGRKLDGHVMVQEGRITQVEPGRYRGSAMTIDLAGQALSPGMIDLMVLGAFGKSVLRDDPLDIARQYLRLGVTHCQICGATLPMQTLEAMAKRIGQAQAAQQQAVAESAEILGLYLEGPFLIPRLSGASMKDYALPATPENIRRVLETMGAVVTMVNVAPGLENDAAAVRLLRQAGKVVSMAHSDAPADRVQACLEAGTTVLGHAWDNNSGLIGDSGVQQPTLEHVALTDERVRFLHLICDGTHVHPVMVKLMVRCRGAEAICLVTDGVTRAGCPDGPYVWEDGRTFVKQGGVGRTDKGWLCGSALLIPDHWRNFVKFTGLPAHEAIRTVTCNPAASLGLEDRLGLIAPGRSADLVAWDAKLRVRRVWRAGVEVKPVSDLAEVEI